MEDAKDNDNDADNDEHEEDEEVEGAEQSKSDFMQSIRETNAKRRRPQPQSPASTLKAAQQEAQATYAERYRNVSATLAKKLSADYKGWPVK